MISREPRWISPDNLATLESYIESVGMDPDRPYPPRGTLDSADWWMGMTERQWQEKQEFWNEVEDEFDSVPFFNEIRKLTQSADFTAGDAYKTDLTAKVWRMLEAMAKDSELRVKLFNEAATPTECVDGGTQLFNAMGLQVLIHEAYALGSVDLIETRLLELAQGKSRLDELGAIARQRVASRLAAGERFRRLDDQGNVTGTIDEVEVHLAYMTDLAQRLDLPWQARGMQFRKIAGVTKEMIDAALRRIVALEEGDLLTDRILEQPLWKTWLESSSGGELDSLKRQIDATTELQDALQRRFEAVEPAVGPHDLAGREPIRHTRRRRHVAEVPPRPQWIAHHIAAAHAGRAGRGLEQSGQHPQRGRLAGAVGAEQPHHLACGHGEPWMYEALAMAMGGNCR